MATILEHIKHAHQEIKEKPPKERLSYFWDYYKWPFLAVVLAVVLLIQGVIGLSNRKDTVFTAFLLNCKIGVDDKDFLQDFYAYVGIDEKTQQAAFYTDITLIDGEAQNNVNSFQRIMAGIVTKETDYIAGKAEAFRMCAYNSSRIFVDLRTVLTEEQLAQFAGRIYYIDEAVLEQLDKPVGIHVEPDLLEYPDPHKPEAMEKPIPVGIDISDRENFRDAYYLPNATVYLGIVANTPRMELALDFLEFLFS